MKSLLVLVLVSVFWKTIEGHGYFVDPPGRNSRWRWDSSAPPNYSDNELNCGGFGRQHNQNGGRCGVCGDPWDVSPPRPHEEGGLYGAGVITRTYRPGETVNANVLLTTHHKGWFEFRLCSRNSAQTTTTFACLDQNLLRLAPSSGQSGTRYMLPDWGSTNYIVPVILPSGLTCTQCVLQWKYVGGNNWYADSAGRPCPDCGPQEEFYGCADIAIRN